MQAATSLSPATLAEWITPITLIMGSILAIRSFSRNARTKAAEIILQVDRRYSEHLPTLLKIEYIRDYETELVPALRRALAEQVSAYDPDESKQIDALENCLRYFVVCKGVRDLRIDDRLVDKLCAYYLRILCSPSRPELAAYVKRFWPVLHLWAPLAGKPLVKRVPIYAMQLKERIALWWKGGADPKV